MSKLTTRAAASQELAEREGPPVAEGFNPDRITGTELALKRIRERRVGGVFVQGDVPLHVHEFVAKGDYPKSTAQERFVKDGRSEEIASQFAEIYGVSAEAEAELEKWNKREADLKRKDAAEAAEKEAAERDALLAAEEAKLKADEEIAEIARKQREEWEAAQQAKDGAYDREPTEEDLALVAEMSADVGPRYDIPQSLLDDCSLPSQVNELVELRKQFNEIDFDGSGSIDAHEMMLALKKMGMEPTEDQVRTLLSASDSEEGDGQVDFGEFVVLVRGFQSSAKERAHQQANRKGLTGFADAVKNIDLDAVEFVETEFGSKKAVVNKKVAHEWQQFVEYDDPLHWAAGKGDLAAVQQYIMQLDDAPEIKAERINKDHKMPMHYAAVWNQPHVLQYLLEKPPNGAGAGVDPSDFNYVTPLMMASESGRSQAVDFLADNWANIVQRNRGGVTPFMLACKFNHLDVAKSLIRSGCVISGCDDEEVRMFSLRRTGLQRTVDRKTNAKGPVFCMEVWMDQIATGHQDGTVRLTSITTQQGPPYSIAGFEKGQKKFEGHKGAVLCVKLERSSTTVQAMHMATGSEDATVRVWRLDTGECIQVMKDTRQGQLPSPVTALDISPQTDRVVSGTRHGLFFMWEMSTGSMLQHYAAHQGMSVNQLQLDGDTLLSASNDRTVRIWDIAANRMRVYQGHDSLVNSAVRIDQTTIRGGGGEIRPEMIVSGSNIGELFTFEVDRRPSNDPIERKGYFSGGKQKGFAFASPVNDIKVVEYGGVQLVIACSTPEGGVRVWNIDGDQGSKPLHTFHGHTDDIRCLAWYGVNVNTTDQVGITPLMTAAELGLEDIVRMLLDCHGIDPWIGDRQMCETALHRAARNGHAGCMRLILEQDPSLIDAGMSNLTGILHLAVLHEARGPECVSIALEYGADVNRLNAEGRTAAHVAARHGRYKAMRLITRARGVVLDRLDAQHPVGGLPLVRPPQAPPEHLHPNLVSAPTQLVTTSFKWVSADPKWKAGANRIKKLTVDSYKLIRHPYGWAPLHEAASYGQTAAAKVLMDAGAAVNIVDDMGRTPLHMACANGTPDLIAALAAHGADPNMRDCHGCVPLMYAVKGTQEPAVEKLLEMYGEELELDAEEEIYGLTALHMAAKYGLDELCFLLLEAGADQNTPDLRRCTPLHYAVSGAVIGLVSDTPPELAMDVRNAAFGMHSKQVADQWVKQWEDGEVHRRGLSGKRLNELREEVKVKNGRYVDTSQVLLDGFSRYDKTDVSGKTAIDYAKSHPVAWESFEQMFANTTPDGQAFMVKGDIIKARYVGEKGTKYEHPNLWEMVSRYGVRCTEGKPTMSGSRAFKRFESRFVKQEVDWRSLGDVKIGEAGEMERKGCTVYELSHPYVEDATGNRARAYSFLCNWKPGPRTFETKFNALHVSLTPGREYDLRIDEVQDWSDSLPAKYKRSKK